MIQLRGTSTFVYLLKLVKPDTYGNMSPEDEAIVDEHFEYLRKGVAKKKVILAGPCLDGQFGIVIFRAISQTDAEEFVKNDPAPTKRIMRTELHPFRISLMGNESGCE